MSKITLDDVTNLQTSSAVTTINNNSDTIVTAFDNTLSLDGTAPNSMAADLDMDSNRIVNLPAAIGNTEPVRLAEFNNAVFSGGMGNPLIGLGAHTFPIADGSGMATGLLLSDAQIIVGTSGDPAAVAVSGDATISDTGAVTVTKVHGVSYAATPSTNTVAVITSSGTATYQQLPNAALSSAAAWTFKGNAGSSAAAPTDFTVHSLTTKGIPTSSDEVIIWDNAGSSTKKATLATTGVFSIDSTVGAFTTSNGVTASGSALQLTTARRTLPTIQVFTASSGTYSTPANTLWIEVQVQGGGAGGAGSGSSTATGSAGGTSAFGTALLIANGGQSTTSSGHVGGAGGTASGGDYNLTGGAGGTVDAGSFYVGGGPGVSHLGGAGGVVVGYNSSAAGTAAKANTGSAGGGAAYNGVSSSGLGSCGAGGGAGGFCSKIIGTPLASYTYSVGAGGTGGAAGGLGAAGGAGAAGIIIVKEHYGT